MLALIRTISGCAAALFVVAGLAACKGSRGHGAVAVRVGDTPIVVRAIAHWSAAIARGALIANPSVSPRQSPREEALAFLISSRWLLEQAAEERARAPVRQLAHQLRERTEATPGGPDRFEQALADAGQTIADVKLELEARWAASVLERRTAARARAIARAQVGDRDEATYYHAHLGRYFHRETRYYDLIERIKSRTAASSIARRLGAGRRFAQVAVKEHPFRPRRFDAPRGEGGVLRAVFSARVGQLVGPLKLRSQWCLFVLRRIESARLQPFSEVRASITHTLLSAHRRKALAGLISAYVQKWTTRTDCKRGYVVQKCRQYRGSKAPEAEPFAGY